MEKMNNLEYDKSDSKSIERFAKALIGRTFLDVLNSSSYQGSSFAEESVEYGNARRKGGLGNLLEEKYFGYKANSESEPDFAEAGVELKVTPYELTQRNEYRAGERLVLTMINYNGPIEADLQESHLWKKCKLILLIYYWRNRELGNSLLYPIKFVSLFTPSKTDLAIIESDYKIIAKKIIEGKAEELSESDTFYLGACTKGATAERSIVPQYYPPHTLAKKRAFCYKNSYMTFVLNEYLVKRSDEFEPIIKEASELAGKSFSEVIKAKIDSYIGKTDKELCLIFNREYNNNKAQWNELAYRMLGIKSNKAEEFRKANITVKIIRIEGNGKNRESISFPPFKYKELINENWEESTLFNYLDQTKFLFVVFRKNKNSYVLKGCQLWNMPYHDLNTTVKAGWEAVVSEIKRGIRFTIEKNSKGSIVHNSLPKKKDNLIIHVRPHAQKSYLEFIDGTTFGNGKRANANQLPDGTWMTDYSFWINNDYIIDQLDESLRQAT